jgi:hypothetical protein
LYKPKEKHKSKSIGSPSPLMGLEFSMEINSKQKGDGEEKRDRI